MLRDLQIRCAAECLTLPLPTCTSRSSCTSAQASSGRQKNHVRLLGKLALSFISMKSGNNPHPPAHLVHPAPAALAQDPLHPQHHRHLLLLLLLPLLLVPRQHPSLSLLLQHHGPALRLLRCLRGGRALLARPRTRGGRTRARQML
jgi:hypothetical protein